MPGDADIAHEVAHRVARRVWRAAQLRRAGLWAAGAVPWLVLRNAPGLLAWSAFCAWDGLRLQRRVAHDWTAWIDEAVPEMEDSSALLLEDPATQAPIARLQRKRLVERLQASLDGPRLRAVARAHVTPGWPWLAADVVLAALAWLSAMQHPHAVQAATAAQAPARKTAATQARAELILKLTPPAYTGVAASTSNPRDLQTPEQTVVEWCLRTPDDAAERIELSDGQALQVAKDCVRWTATESMFWRWRGKRYTLKVIPDQPPEISISQPNEMTHDLARDAASARIALSVRDDYRIQQATMHLTLARGSGENIKFSDRELPLPVSNDPRKRDWAKDWPLAELGMQPGDELYFFIRASDNAFKPHTVQSATYTLRLPAPPSDKDEDSAALPMMVKPESLRSQRQIIIDTEQLVADLRNKKLPEAEARERSERIADDEAVLRRRYGQFLGEESTLFGKDDDHDEPAHGKDKDDVLHQFGHAHDQPENATLFDDATKKVLRRALAAMWDAEKSLRAIQPKSALPPENTALVAIKELQQSERIYLHKTSSEIPPIKEDKRLSGDMAGSASFKRAQGEANDPVPADLRALVRSLGTDGPLPALWTRTAHDWVRERVKDDEQRLNAQRAIQDVADGCLACRPVLRAWLRGGVDNAPVLLQARPDVQTRFGRALAGGQR
ncbi:hypothetical protein [Massilia sp. 9096]|uniref:hypothetical protein n=1 Tax=Massilia sp. 9096 TaxID=1500894 RepID=UPI00068C2BC5|nr:hypothetical protein [Massilia sp. 9096]